jgi:hypothetical protein
MSDEGMKQTERDGEQKKNATDGGRAGRRRQGRREEMNKERKAVIEQLSGAVGEK